MTRRWSTSILLAVAVTVHAAPALASVTFQDDFEDGVILPADWTITGGAFTVVEEADGVLRTAITGEGPAAATVTRAFAGDFDVQVDFELLNFPPIWIVWSYLLVEPVDNVPPAALKVKRERHASADFYEFERYDPFVWTSLGTADRPDTTGKFRIQRTGDQFAGYYWAGGWQSLGQTQYFTGPVNVTIGVDNSVNFPIVVATYDNFQIVAEAFAADCNSNGIDDLEDRNNCDNSPWCTDCNNNAVIDVCDIAGGQSSDDDANGVPDECEVAPPIPALSPWGMGAMALALVLAATALNRRRAA